MRISFLGFLLILLLLPFSLEAQNLDQPDFLAEYGERIASEGLIIGKPVRIGSFTFAVVSSCETGSFATDKLPGSPQAFFAVTVPDRLLVYDGSRFHSEDLTGKDDFQLEGIINLIYLLIPELTKPNEIRKFFKEF